MTLFATSSNVSWKRASCTASRCSSAALIASGPVADAGSTSPRANKAHDACVGVLEVRCRVAVEGQHGVPVEDVVAGSILGKVRVLHRANAHGTRHIVHFRVAQVRVLGFDQRPGPRLGFLDKVKQARAAALARLEWPSVLTEHRAEGVVFEGDAGTVAGDIGQGEQLPKVHRLACIDDVEDAFRFERVRTVAQRRKIGGVIKVATVGLAHDDRHRTAVLGLELVGVLLRDAVREHAQRAIGFGEQILGAEVLDDAVQVRVVGALSAHVFRP